MTTLIKSFFTSPTIFQRRIMQALELFTNKFSRHQKLSSSEIQERKRERRRKPFIRKRARIDLEVAKCRQRLNYALIICPKKIFSCEKCLRCSRLHEYRRKATTKDLIIWTEGAARAGKSSAFKCFHGGKFASAAVKIASSFRGRLSSPRPT